MDLRTRREYLVESLPLELPEHQTRAAARRSSYVLAARAPRGRVLQRRANVEILVVRVSFQFIGLLVRRDAAELARGGFDRLAAPVVLDE